MSIADCSVEKESPIAFKSEPRQLDFPPGSLTHGVMLAAAPKRRQTHSTFELLTMKSRLMKAMMYALSHAIA
jgi:hypothetical protein